MRGALRRHILFVAMWLHFRADAGSGMGRLGATICFWSVGWMLGGLRPVGGGGRAPHVVSDQLVGFCGTNSTSSELASREGSSEDVDKGTFASPNNPTGLVDQEEGG